MTDGEQFENDVTKQEDGDASDSNDQLFATGNASELTNSLGSEASQEFEVQLGHVLGADQAQEATHTSETGTGDFTENLAPGDLIGRYEYVKHLGRGGFGCVIKALDHRLNRPVAIKIPHRHMFEEDAASFLEEARSVARLSHESIIRVFNVEATEDDGWPFVVMEYVDGPTLADVIGDGGLNMKQAVRYLIQIARALKYAHGESLIHRDIKPANVIISSKEKNAKLADFGMALHDLTPDSLLRNCAQGTPPYMAPEQLRAENHRLDGRTDIWGFGVLMYILLTGRKPFMAGSVKELVKVICHADPIPVREHAAAIHPELERICLKCIEKLMRDRYQSAKILVDDLVAFEQGLSVAESESLSDMKVVFVDQAKLEPLAQTASVGRSRTGQGQNNTETFDHRLQLIPKGLRSYGQDDGDFFLDLLPGPKDRNGIPDSIRFWLNQLDNKSIPKLNVGMIYGPSGCGKSSFVKAGLIPQLEKDVQTIYLESSPADTERELLDKLHETMPNLVRDGTELPNVLARIRRGQRVSSERILIVIDQFEQWLSAQSEFEGKQLVEALRQCDGENLTCLLLVRDDFWMSASQFMNHLDLRIQEGVNALGIPLFDRKHARKVLLGYGRAMGTLPSYGESISSTQKRFVSEAIEQMAKNGKVIPIQIAMFSQMMEGEKWEHTELKKQGGLRGIGLRFVQKIFSDKRLAHANEISRDAIKALLPGESSDIKNVDKPFSSLHRPDASSRDKQKLHSVLDLLDREYRIVTPVESEGTEPHYQLAHDSLVAPLRIWLDQKQNETWQGRARSRMSQLARQWEASPENRFFPSPLEFLPIRMAVKNQLLDQNEKKYLKTATRFYFWRSLIVILVIAIAIWQLARLRSQTILTQVRSNYAELLSAPAPTVQARLELLEQSPERYVRRAIDEWEHSKDDSRESLRAVFAQAYFCDRADEFPATGMLEVITQADFAEVGNAIKILSSPRMDAEILQEIQGLIDKEYQIVDYVQARTRLAITDFALGRESKLRDLARLSDDPAMRELLIDGLFEVGVSIPKLVNTLLVSEDPALLSLLCKVAGLLKPDDLESSDREELAEAIKGLYLENEEAIVHASAEFALKRWSVELPVWTQSMVKKHWQVKVMNDGSTLTFAKVGPHPTYTVNEDEELVAIPFAHSIWVCDREVSSRLFFEYVKEQCPRFLPMMTPNYRLACNLTGDVRTTFLLVPHSTHKHFENTPIQKLADSQLPVYGVTWMESIRFCNWLSERSGLEPKYRFDEERNGWVIKQDADGFRLPRDSELEAIIRARTRTLYPFGDSYKRISRYGWVGQDDFLTDGLEVQPSAMRMPNDFGLFDTIGNAAEWCFDRDEESEPSDILRSVRGGAANSERIYFQSWKNIVVPVYNRFSNAGIRLILDTND